MIFESLDHNAIRSAALRVNGAAGPSGLDSHEWRRLCTSHKGASSDLCTSLGSVAIRISTTYVHPPYPTIRSGPSLPYQYSMEAWGYEFHPRMQRENCSPPY